MLFAVPILFILRSEVTKELMSHRSSAPGGFSSNWRSNSPEPANLLPSRTTRRRLALPWINYSLAVFAYALLAIFWQASPAPSHVTALAILIAAICLYPLFLWSAKGSEGAPMFELICLAYLMAYSAPIFLVPNTIVRLSKVISLDWEMVFQALQLALLGIVSMIVGYYALRRNVFGWPLPRVQISLTQKASQLYITFALVMGLLIIVLRTMQIVTVGGNWDTLALITAQQANIAVALLAYRLYKPREVGETFSQSRAFTLLWVVVGFLSLVGLASGMLQNVLAPLAIVAVIRWHMRRKFPIGVAFAGIAIYMILNPVKNEYRREAWFKAPNQSVTQRISLWADLTRESLDSIFSGDSSDDNTQDFQKSMRRFSLIHNFAEVRRQTPSVVPYYNGSSYTYLIYALIPRPLWPDKPIAQEANILFSLDYGILTTRGTRTTMIGIGHLPEAYANFGVIGVVAIMFLQGAFFALLDRMLNNAGSEGSQAIYLSTMIYFLNGIGSATASLFFMAILFIVPNAILLGVFARFWRGNGRSAQDRYLRVGGRYSGDGAQENGWNGVGPFAERGK